jgi:hypothetical protein
MVSPSVAPYMATLHSCQFYLLFQLSNCFWDINTCTLLLMICSNPDIIIIIKFNI